MNLVKHKPTVNNWRKFLPSTHYSSFLDKKKYEKSVTKSLSHLENVLQQYDIMLNKNNLREETMHRFLHKNLLFLEPSYKIILSKGELRAKKMPEADFFVQTFDGNYIVIEIESPNDNIFTHEKRPSASKYLRVAMTQIQNYLSEIKNNLLFYRNDFPDLCVENLEGLLIIGRRSKLGYTQIEALRKLNAVQQGYRITTFDDLLEKPRAFIGRVFH